MKVEQLFGFLQYVAYSLPDNDTIGNVVFKCNKAIELQSFDDLTDIQGKMSHNQKVLESEGESLHDMIACAILFDMIGEVARVIRKLRIDHEWTSVPGGKADAVSERA